MLKFRVEKVGQPDTKGSSRARLATSCYSCRRKKVKCDKKKPCTNCVKSGCHDQCEYESIRWANTKVTDEGSLVNEASISQAAAAKKSHNENGKSGSEQVSNSIYVELLQKEIAQLKLRVASYEESLASKKLNLPASHPPIDEFTTISLYDGYNPIQVSSGQIASHGPFSWFAIVKKDKFLKLNWYALMIVQTKMMSEGMSSEWNAFFDPIKKNVENVIKNTAGVGVATVFTPPGFIGQKLSAEVLKLEKEERHQFLKTRLGNLESVHAFSNANLFGHNLDSKALVREYLLSILPHKRVAWLCISRFFKYCYPCMPFLDEADFIDDVSRIIGFTEYKEEPISMFKVTRAQDYATVSLLVIIISLGYLSLTGIDTNNCSPDELYLKQHPVGLGLPVAARKFIHEFYTFSDNSLPLLQCELFLSLYYKFAPESFDFADPTSRLINGMMIQMALSLGLNRDPEKLGGLSVKNEKMYNLRRKIWWGVKSFDFYHKYLQGSPSPALVECSDTKMSTGPTLDTKNNFSLNLDKAAFSKLRICAEAEQMVVQLASGLLHAKNRTDIKEAIHVFDNLERHLVETWGSLDDIIAKKNSLEGWDAISHDFEKASDICSHIAFSSVRYTIGFHLMLHFEHIGDSTTALYYCSKLMRITAEFFQVLPYLVDYPKELFGKGFQYFIIPSIEMAMHKYILLLTSTLNRMIVLRAQLQLKGALTPKANSQLMGIFKLSINQLTRNLIPLNKLADKYYYAWKMGKAHLIIFSIVFANVEKGDFPVFPVLDPKTGKMKLKAKWDDENVIHMPETSYCMNFGEAELSTFLKDMEDSYSSTAPLKVLAKLSGGVETHAASSASRAGTYADNKAAALEGTATVGNDLEMLTSLEIDSIWRELFSKGGNLEDGLPISGMDDSLSLLTPFSIHGEFEPSTQEAETTQFVWSQVFDEMNVNEPVFGVNAYE